MKKTKENEKTKHTDTHSNLHHMAKLQSTRHWRGRANNAKPPSSSERQGRDAQSRAQHHFRADCFFKESFSSLQEAERGRQSAGSRLRGERSHARQTRWPHCSLLRLRTQQALVQEQKAHTSHLQSGSPCLHTGKCWRSGDWAKGRGGKVKGQTKNTYSKEDQWPR